VRLLAAALALVPSVAAAQVPWTLRAPSEARQTGVFAERRIDESSGLAASRQHPGLLWTIEDSGNPAALHAVDTSGTILGTWRIEGARNADWEAIALGPCGTDSCLYIADTGDNGARRSTVTIYRIREPSIQPDRRRGRTTDARISRPDVLTLRYPDGAHDVEALVVTPGEELILISKGRREAVRAYRLERSAWSADRAVTAHPLGTLPMPTEGIAGLVTDAALHPDGRRLVVRTYAALHYFTLAADSAPEAGARPTGCAILGLELQGEGVTWLDEATLALSSEAAYGMPGTISLVRCPHS
jgi:hypothetical protein